MKVPPSTPQKAFAPASRVADGAWQRLAQGLGVVLALAFAAFSPAPATAQPATGVITGIVSNSAGVYLEGAEIVVEGTNFRTTSARGGTYQLNGVPTGPKKVTISYPGTTPVTEQLVVSPNSPATLSTRLSSDAIVLEAFTVNTAREGMSAAIAQQKASFQSKLVAASDQFGDISEGNIGEYLKFLPGVGVDYTANDARALSLRGLNPIFTNVTVDGGRIASGTSSGDSRRFELEQVAINNVETIEVFKTMTPDMSADNTGGQINLITKSALDRETKSVFDYNVSLTGNSEHLTFSKRGAWGNEAQILIRPNLDLNYARRIGDKIGLNISYRLSEITHDYPRAGYTWNFTQNGATASNPYLATMQTYNEQKITHRESLSTKVDYLIAPRTKLSLTGQWNWYDLTFNGRSINFLSGTPVAGFSPNRVTSTAGTGNVTTDVSQRNKSGPTYILGAQFVHEFDKGKLTGGYSWSQAGNKYRDISKGYLTSINLNLLRPTGSNTVVDLNNILTQTLPTFTVTQTAGSPNYRDLTNYSIAANQWRTRPFTSTELKAGLNLDYRYELGGNLRSALQVGVRTDDTSRKIRRLGINYANPALTGAQLKAYRDDLFSNQDIGFGFGALEWLSPYKTYAAFSTPFNTYTEYVTRNIEESNNAGYVRLDFNPLGDLQVVTGARYEKKTMDASAQDLRAARSRAETANLKYDGWYPSLNLKYTPRNDLVFRTGISRTIGHPDFADIIPNVADYDSSSSSSTGTLSIPNPGIKPYKITNYDVTGEWYLKNSGVLSGSVFYKTVKGFIARGSSGLLSNLSNAAAIGQEYGISPADFNRYTVTQSNNDADSSVKGIELSYAQGLTFLPKPFNTLSIQANFTKVKVQGDTFSVYLAQLMNATTQSANFITSWRLGAATLLATVNYVDAVETAFGTTATAPSTFNKAVTKADFTVNYKVHQHATIYFQVRNIFGEGRAEFQTPSDPALFRNFTVPSRYAEFGDPIFYLGVKGRF